MGTAEDVSGEGERSLIRDFTGTAVM